jgi:hypothetical protein
MLLPALLNVGALSADTMDCTATEVHGMPAEGQPAIAPQLVCTTGDEGFDIAFDGEVNL